MGWQFWIDRGGTFTDIVARRPDGTIATAKLLSEDPRYPDAAVAGIRRLLGLADTDPLPPHAIDAVKMGTTVATNALLERKGAATLLLVDFGFGDLLAIGHQARPRLFDLDIRRPAPLYAAVEEVGGRVSVDGETLVPVDEAAVLAMLCRHRDAGLEACAIALVHGWRHPAAERRLAALAREAGFAQVSASHEVSPLIGLVARGRTTVVDAYLSPVLARYVDRVAAALDGVPLSFMQSNGALADAGRFRGRDAILSGPAGGVVGAARTAEAAGFDRVIGFDMGGTSTDVALYAGRFERRFDTEVAGVEMRVPMMAIDTIAAGGGSILTFDGARYRVGPESAGAVPGPASYRRGGPLTVTDANVMTGRIAPDHFPALFGAGGDRPLDARVVAERFAALADEVAQATGERPDPRAVADGFLRVAVAQMAAAIKRLALEKGADLRDYALQCFGGAGGQHACRVADELGMTRILIHPYAGVLSAYGMGLADRGATRQSSVERPLDAGDTGLAAEADALARAATDALGTPPTTTTLTAQLRYAGTDTALDVAFADADAMRAAFGEAHRRRFGFADPGRAIQVQALVAEAVARSEAPAPPPPATTDDDVGPVGRVAGWIDGAETIVPVHDRATLPPGTRIAGPAMLREAIATSFVEPGWTAQVLAGGELLLTREGAVMAAADDATVDPVSLELFNSLFMGVAEQMGAVLRATSTSVNIRERLDFSCALFDAAGRLVANAPHVPVHLGAMGESVRTVLAARGRTLRPGDAIVLNNPYNGGTHLPDVTLVSPVFDADGKTLRFVVANRGHHADIGGRTPGSTPPDSTTLEEEGIVIDDFRIVHDGVFDEAGFRALLAGGRWPARNPDVNVADIRAQLAANRAGADELAALVDRHGWATVHAHMAAVMANAEESIRRVVDRLSDGSAEYRMDDGAALRVAVRIDRAGRGAVIDFAGTDPARDGNFNAPRAVTTAAVLYAFRCLVGDDLPLNEGCLAPLDIRIPAGCFLDPPSGRAVVAGNTEVSQAVVNALLEAMGAAAHAQGTMNNFLFGTDAFQYYETICGGSGAGPGFAGADAVQTHMTNTRTTDPEILELRYPVRLEAFAIRRGSGGGGAWRGGDGAVRTVRALEPMTATLVSSRRTVPPAGLAGGGDGAAGRQAVLRADGAIEPIPGIARVELAAGDVIRIETPGGGGHG